MFGWLKGGKQGDPVESARQLAHAAVIEAVAEKGLYAAFFVRLIDDLPAADQFKNHAALTAFVEVIEERLTASDFDPILEEHQSISGFPPLDHTTDRRSALRAVLAPDDSMVFKWNR